MYSCDGNAGYRVRSFVACGLTVVGSTQDRGDEQCIPPGNSRRYVEPAFLSNNARIEELESQPAPNCTDLDRAGEELESTLHAPHFSKDSARLIGPQVQVKSPHFCDIEAAHVAAVVAQGAANSSVQPLSASDLALQGELGQLTKPVSELTDKVTRTGQECDCNMKDNDFQARWPASAS